MPIQQKGGVSTALARYADMPVALLLCFALFVDLVVFGGHDKQRMVELALFAAGVAIALQRMDRVAPALFGAGAGRPLAAFFILGVLGATCAFSPAYAAFEVASLFLLYVLASMAAADIAAAGPGALTKVLRWIGTACALYVLVFAVRYVASLVLRIPLDLDDLTSGFSNIRFFNHVQTATLPLLVLLCRVEPAGARLRWLWLAVAGYWWMALFASTGRGTLVGVVAACAVVALLLRRAAWPYLKAVALTAALGLLAYFVLLVAIPALAGMEGMHSFTYAAERTAADPASGRLFLWRRALELIAQHPLLGVGPMHFAHHAGDLHTGAHPHDWLLQVASEWGLPALACLLGAVGLGLRALLGAGKHIAQTDETNRTIHAAMLVGAVAILVDGLVSGLFVMPASRLAIALYLGCALGWYRGIVPVAAPVPVAGKWMRAGAILAVVAALACTAAVWPEALARYRDEPLSAAQEAANTGVHWPRLWEAGFF